MRTALALSCALWLAAPVAALDVPSNQRIAPLDILWERADGATLPALVLRFLAPDIGEGPDRIDYDEAEADMDRLCALLALPLVGLAGPVSQVTVVLLDRPLRRGEPDPEALMFMSGYLVEDDECLWDPM